MNNQPTPNKKSHEAIAEMRAGGGRRYTGRAKDILQHILDEND